MRRSKHERPVSVEPYTHENRAAHGNVVVTEECEECGGRREVNVNGRHVEYGVFALVR